MLALLILALLPTIHHAVSTNAAAQGAFDRGLLDYYAYNPEAAEHEFYTAADLDSHLAMAYWGIALSNAPNLNVPANDDRNAQARRAIAKAKGLENYATPEDRAFIDAADARFDGDAKASASDLEVAYRDALQRIAKAYPNDPDATALYLEAELNIVAAGDRGDAMTAQDRATMHAAAAALLPAFQASLALFPMHVGIEHYYIHAAQAARRSDLAVDAATHLASFTFPPEDSHLTHMPGHTFFDVGMYQEGLDVAQRSVAMDVADYACCHPGFYSATRYYHNHNVSFLLYALTQTGNTAEAVTVAQREANPLMIARQLVAAAQWQQLLALDTSAVRDPSIPFARGLAYAHLGDAGKAQAALAAIPDGRANSPANVADIAAMRLTLSAEIAELKGEDTKALQLLADASAQAAVGQALATPEMPTLYYYSPHMALAALATKMGKTDVARAALQAELVASPKSNAALAALAKLGST